jgi:predicted transglutaminase-like cysteine proteinase
MRGVVFFVAAMLLVLARPAEAAQQYPQIFGSQETPSSKVALFQKWKGVLDRYTVEKRFEETPCTEGPFNRCFLQKWKTFLNEIRGFAPIEAMREVNRFANHARYVTDPVNYGMPDYWATPSQFLVKNGDCEDYAITKFLSLRALGFDNDMMRIVVLDDLNLRTPHAVLVVYIDGTAWLLDNQIRDVVRTTAARHYRAIYSLNETTWWLHRYERR